MGMLAACSASEWREWRPDDSGLHAQTPCRPSTHARDVTVADTKRRMTLHTCSADDHLYSIAWLDVAMPADVAASLLALTTAARLNVSAGEARAEPLAVAGSTPQAAAGRWAWSGRWPDGRVVQQQTAVFSRGMRVFQATITADAVDGQRAHRFFDALNWRP